MGMSMKVGQVLWGICSLAVICTQGCTAMTETISSPDGHIRVTFLLDEQGQPQYAVQLDGNEVIRPSALGLIRSDAAFDRKLTLVKSSPAQAVRDDYQMFTGKRKDCSYRANRRVFTLENPAGGKMDIIFQVSNDGTAFRYRFPETSGKTVSVTEEKTAFAFAPDTFSWLHPMPESKSGWSRTQPSYEEYYVADTVGKPSSMGFGWCLPALFKTSGGWVLICDSDVDETYCAARLAHRSDGGVYRIALPQPQDHRGPEDPVAPQIQLPFRSPWRVLIIGPSMNTLVASTLETDVASPCKLDKTDFIHPGKAAWHWLRYGDDSATLPVAHAFLDFAVKMKWPYILIDANWDQKIGYEKMAEFVKEAAAKNVGVILWYNSNGAWNDAPMGPKNRMHERGVRREEFARLQKMGVKGVKVDFFGGDKQATMKLYLDLIQDAADFGMLVNCHGATVPRGWQRTYPNLVSMEAVRGMEYCTFDQRNTDQEPRHACTLPFTRNVIGSMDFTPVVFNPKIRGVHLVTLPAFELALSVVFESGIQHLGLVPEEAGLMPDYVVRFLQDVPTVWEDTRLVDGRVGEYVVMARRTGDTWYIAGINGRDEPITLSPDLAFLPVGARASLITDGPGRSFTQTKVRPAELQKFTVDMKPHGGFVMTVKP